MSHLSKSCLKITILLIVGCSGLMQQGGAMQGLSLAEPNILWLAILAFHLKNLVAKRTIQVYNLFQDLFNWFIILEGGYRVQSCFGTKALPTD